MEQWIQVEPWIDQSKQQLDRLMDWVQQQPAAQFYSTLAILFLSSIFFMLGQVTILFLEPPSKMEWVQRRPAAQFYATFAILFLSSIFFVLVRVLKRTKSNTIVLAGLSGSGKTILFYQLRDGSSHQGTVTSMDPNEGSFVLHSESEKKGKIKPVHVVDVPGHYRLRPKLDEFLPQAAGLVFVVDALDFLPNCRAAAEYLYDILTKAAVVKRKIPLLIVCNKTDKVSAHSKDFIRKQLEKEIDKLRVSRTGDSAADIADEFTLGVSGEPFVFSQCLNKVMLAESSGLTGEISQVEQFIREYVRC